MSRPPAVTWVWTMELDPGKTPALAELVTRYHALVCAVAYGATGDRALSEDVAQDTFVVAWRGRDRLRDPSRIRQWLCAIARHLALNTRRAPRHEPIEADAAIPAEVDLHAGLEREEQGALVWHALASIPETYRVAMVLYYREDKSVAEVARTLGISEANALQRLARGRRHLQRGIEDLVERSLAASKPDRTRREAVIAAVAADLTPVSADAALEAARVAVDSASWKTMLMKIAIATCATAGAVALAHWGCAAELEREPAAAGSQRVAPLDDREREPADADAAREQSQLAELERASQARRGGRGRGAHQDDATSTQLPSYRLSLVDADGVAVNLAGGASGLMGANEALGIDLPTKPREPQRTISGRVVDASGAPVPGAVVIAGSHLTMMLETSVSARAGDETDARGRFEVSVDATESCAVLALHAQGWSAIEHLAAGTTDASLDLELGAPVRVHGTARRGGSAQDGAVLLIDGPRNVLWSFPTDDAGNYEALVPRGAFTLGFRAGERLSASEPQVRKPIDLRAGAELAWDPEIAIGTRLVVDVPMPTGDAEDVVMFWVGVVPGRSAPKDVEALRALAKRDDTVLLRGHGGEDLDEVFEFEDLSAGSYTVCAHADPRKPTAAPAYACREVAVKTGEAVQELKMSW